MSPVAVAIVAAASMVGTVRAAEWPPFQLVRSNENYAAARDPALRATLPEPYKFLALSANGAAWLSLGGEIRERYDFFDSPRFGIGTKSDAYALQRILLHADLHVGSRFRFYVELGNHDVFAKRTAILPSDKDPTDIQSAFIDFAPVAGEHWRLRVGRQELLLNPTQRFFGVREGPNIRQSYDGARVSWSNTLWKIDAFTLRPVLAKPQAFDDRGDPNTRFSGLYLSRRLEHIEGNVDGFWFSFDRRNAKYGNQVADERRRGIGGRVVLKAGGWDLDCDVLLQYGIFDTADIRAWGFGIAAGRSFNMPWRPRLGLRLDGASGGVASRFESHQNIQPSVSARELLRREHIDDLRQSSLLATEYYPHANPCGDARTQRSLALAPKPSRRAVSESVRRVAAH